jgi:hypothetical protein
MTSNPSVHRPVQNVCKPVNSNVGPLSMRLLLAILFTVAVHMPAFAENPLLKGAIKATPVVYWASLGRTEIVKELLVKGASPN